MIRHLLSAFFLSVALAAPALMSNLQASTLAQFTFDSPEAQTDFRELIEEMRCLVCQNESLAGSNAELAQDLRNELYDLVRSGKSKQEIIEFMVARYGDFVLYNPPLKPSTYILWFGPAVFFIVGLILLLRTLRRKKAAPEQTLSQEDKDRLKALLDTKTQGQEK